MTREMLKEELGKRLDTARHCQIAEKCYTHLSLKPKKRMGME